MEETTLTSPEILQNRESCWPEILKRVPASQLGICSCVSKKWNSLITSQTFISSQTNFLSQTQLQSSNLFLIRSFFKPNPLKKGQEQYHICSDTTSPPNNTPESTLNPLNALSNKTIPCPFKTRNGLHFRLVGSVNGVIFLSDDHYGNTYNFILWNPLVNCFIHLPKPRLCFAAIGPYMNASGFGYDSVNDDFKVVRLAYPGTSSELDEIPPKAELYSVKEGKWKWVSTENVEYCTTDFDWSQCFVKRSVHWVAYERFGEENGCSHKSTLLLLFNVEKEKFIMMKLPLELRDVCPSSLMVSEFRGMLCVKHYVMTEMLLGELVGFNLWVKKEYDNSKSWCKVASVDLRGSLQQVLYWKKNGELVILSKDKEVVSYDPETKKEVVLATRYAVHYDACSYVESLAFLNKDIKNSRSFFRDEDENDSSDDEKMTTEKIEFINMGKMAAYWLQLKKYRREF